MRSKDLRLQFLGTDLRLATFRSLASEGLPTLEIYGQDPAPGGLSQGVTHPMKSGRCCFPCTVLKKSCRDTAQSLGKSGLDGRPSPVWFLLSNMPAALVVQGPTWLMALQVGDKERPVHFHGLWQVCANDLGICSTIA